LKQQPFVVEKSNTGIHMQKKSTKYLIAGAGLSGLTFADFLDSDDWLIIEKERLPGGYSATDCQEGFCFDWTGHWLHLKKGINDWIRDYTKLHLQKVERKAKIWFRGNYMPYPFQTNLASLDRSLRLECLREFLQRPRLEGNSFADVLLSNFGRGIYKHFLLPYNSKLWGVSPEKMDGEYAMKYVPRPDESAVIEGASKGLGKALGYNNCFYYPRRGTMGDFCHQVASRLDESNLYLDWPLTKVDLDSKTAQSRGGQQINYEKLVFTFSLADFMSLCHSLPPRIKQYSNQLTGRKIYFLDLGIKDNLYARHFHWCYIPEPQYKVYRLGQYSEVEPSLAPAGCRSLYLELSSPFSNTREALEAVEPLLKEMNLINDSKDIVFSRLRSISDGYAVPDNNYYQARKEIFSFLKKVDIIPLGRFACWRYSSMGEDMHRARELAFSLNNS
jgi:protoporphyrinogen oxidase